MADIFVVASRKTPSHSAMRARLSQSPDVSSNFRRSYSFAVYVLTASLCNSARSNDKRKTIYHMIKMVYLTYEAFDELMTTAF